MHRIRWKPLLTWFGIILAVYLLSGLAAMNAKEVYGHIVKPAFAPPAAIFPFVWGALYLLMVISAYLVQTSGSPRRTGALAVFCAQLIVNGLWPLLFFRAEWFFLSFLWILALWLLLCWMLVEFHKIRPIAAWLQIPYFLWTSFAAVLNGAVWLLNR